MNFNIMPQFSVDFEYQTQVSAQFRQTILFERILDGTNCDFITPCDIVSFSETSSNPLFSASTEACVIHIITYQTKEKTENVCKMMEMHGNFLSDHHRHQAMNFTMTLCHNGNFVSTLQREQFGNTVLS